MDVLNWNFYLKVQKNDLKVENSLFSICLLCMNDIFDKNMGRWEQDSKYPIFTDITKLIQNCYWTLKDKKSLKLFFS